MSKPLIEEVRRIAKLWLGYGKVIIGGMLLSGICLFLYAGIRANYVSIAVLTTVVSTISLSFVMLVLYVRFHEKRAEALTPHNRADDEELRRRIVETIARFSSTKTKSSKKSLLLVSVFQWGHLIGKMFYYGLTMVKVESGLTKGPKNL